MLNILRHPNTIALITIVRRETIRFLRIWKQTLLPPVVSQSLYFIIFGGFLGSQIQAIKGIPYMQFIVPGLVMMAVINASFSNTASSFFIAKFQRNIEELLVSPVPNWIVILGFTVGGMLRGVLTGLIVFIISFMFTLPRVEELWLVILCITITSIVFSLGGLINAVLAKKFDDISIFPTFVLTPLTYLGGVFYSIDKLPDVWQKVSQLNPVFYMVDVFRYGFYHVNDVNIWVSMALLLALCVILWFVALYYLKKGTGLRS